MNKRSKRKCIHNRNIWTFGKSIHKRNIGKSLHNRNIEKGIHKRNIGTGHNRNIGA